MTPRPNGAFDALPNVLRNQTAPNTLGRLGPPGRAVRPRPRLGGLVAIAVLGLALLAIVLGRAG